MSEQLQSLLQGVGMTSQRTRDRLVQRLAENGIRDERVLDRMRHTPRHIFVDEALASRAYEDSSLPIGHGQTISQPFIVARMTEILLGESPCQRVLEVGTGSGYQTAVLAGLVDQLFSVERIRPLLDRARERFRMLRLNNVQLKCSDGSWGWAQRAPFDGILVTAAPSHVPSGLLEQLADGGRMVIPVGTRDGEQQLVVIRREGSQLHQQVLDRVSFVPLLEGVSA